MKTVFLRALRAVAPPRRHSEEVVPLPDQPRVLLLQLQQIGDSMVVAPLIRALDRRYPAMTLDVLAAPPGYAVHRKSPHVHAFHRVPDARHLTGGAWRRALRDIRAVGYDCVIACVNQVSFRYGLIAWATGAPRRMGFDVDGAGAFYTQRLAVGAESVIAANMRVARALGADDAPVEEFWFDDADRAAAAALVGGDPFVVVHPGSNWQSKTWYPDRWAAVADALAEREHLRPVFVGTAADGPLVASIQALMHHPSTSLVGATDLCQLGAVIERAELCVGTDSGPRHIAGALGRPLVTVMSSLDLPHRWTFTRPHEIVLRTDPECRGCLQSYCSHRTCLDRVTVDAVLAACAAARHSSHFPIHAA